MPPRASFLLRRTHRTQSQAEQVLTSLKVWQIIEQIGNIGPCGDPRLNASRLSVTGGSMALALGSPSFSMSPNSSRPGTCRCEPEVWQLSLPHSQRTGDTVGAIRRDALAPSN